MKLLPFLLNFCLLGAALRTAVRRPGGRGQSGVIPDHAINNDSCDETDVECDENDLFRRHDGVCNNLEDPYLGAANSVMKRLLGAEYYDCKETPKGGYEDGSLYQERVPKTINESFHLRVEIKKYGCRRTKGDIQQLPNVREVSSTFHTDLDVPQNTYSLMVMQFGQFLDHDMALTPEVEEHGCCENPKKRDCFPIYLPNEDPFYSTRRTPQKCQEFTRSEAFCPEKSKSFSKKREQFSIVTSFVDGSQVYSPNLVDARLLRTLRGGEIKTHADYTRELLPVIHGNLKAGDIRALDMPGLTTIHTLFIREHNRIARHLQARYSDDEEIYQRARRVVIAELQSIVYGEYLPIILGKSGVKKYGLRVDRSTEYNSREDPSVLNSFTTAAYRFGHSLIQGLVNMADPSDPAYVMKTYRLRENFFNMENYLVDDGRGMDRIVAGLIGEESQTMDKFVTEDVTNHLFLEVGENTGHLKRDFGGDLVARNLQRGRDHGLPGYNKYRRYCGLKSLSSFNERHPAEISKDNWRILGELYKTPDDIDLFVGGLAEYRYNDGLTGPTFNCIKGIQFEKLMYGDRFFFTHRNQVGSFTPAQLKQLRKRTLRDIICQNTEITKARENVFLLRGKMKDCEDVNQLDLDLF